MTFPAVRHSVRYNGRALAPGEVFRPLADHPDYEVLFVGLVGTTATFTDGWGAWSEDLTPKESST